MRRTSLFAVILAASLALAGVLLFTRATRDAVPNAPAPTASTKPAVTSRPNDARAAPSARERIVEEHAEWAKTDPRSEALCPEGMVLVDGSFCPYVGHRCKQWISEKQDRCAVYSTKEICEGRPHPMRFCIDRYEYPNVRGLLPVVMVDWTEAADACRAEGKRLCTESEWNFACEGPDRWPYPYGYERDASACNIDRQTQAPDVAALETSRRVSREVSRLDQREPSGSRARCLSPFGVFDTTGNVDEWVVNERGEPDVSGLKGGYFGRIRARCRPMTTFHNRWFRFYQVGFRCCSDLVARP